VPSGVQFSREAFCRRAVEIDNRDAGTGFGERP
jgi:hypothetical protein